MSKQGDLRVWWMPQIPMKKSFRVSVSTLDEAVLLLDVLADYDLFQFENRIKPDYSNMGGLEIFDDGDWSDWEDADGNDVNHYVTIRNEKEFSL